MASTLTAAERHQVYYLLGPWVVGAFVDVLCQGVLFCQFLNYFMWYRDDKLVLRLVVAGLALATTLKSMQAFLIVWEQNIVAFGDVTGAVYLAYTTWWETGNGLMVAAINLYVQAFFLHRLYSITAYKWVIYPIGAIILFAFLGSIMATYYTVLLEGTKIGLWYAAGLSAAFVGDFLLSVTTAFALLKASKNGLKQTKDLISRLVRLTWQTAAPAALCAMLNLIFSQVYNGEDVLISSAFNMALCKIYAISMMWTLNARRHIRVAGSSGYMTSSSDRAQTIGRSRRTGDVELGRLGTLQIRTDVETVQRVDHIGAGVSFIDTKQDGTVMSTRRSEEEYEQDSAHSIKANAL